MSVKFTASDPKSLLKAFDDRIAQTKQEGRITTWEKLSDGVHYTHKAVEWRNKAFFKPKFAQSKLVFNIVKPKDAAVKAIVYGYYHGHLIETFLNHFDQQFSEGAASALPDGGDLVA